MSNDSQKYIIISIIVVILLAIVGVGIWLLSQNPFTSTSTGGAGSTSSSGFTPFGRTPTGGGKAGQVNGTSTNSLQNGTAGTPIPTLRLLSNTPVGGYGATTTASTTVVRWADRGRGNVLEAHEDTWDITTISNTLVPRIYESAWNKDLTAFIASILPDGQNAINTGYAELNRGSTGTSSTSFNPVGSSGYSLIGKSLPNTIQSYAISPKKDRIFFFAIENGRGVGYTSPINGGTLTQIFNTPVTQVNVSWPEDNTLAIVTKGTASESGYLYFVNPKSGVWNKILGPLPGLSAIVSHDAKNVFISTTGSNNDIVSYIYSVSKNKGTDAIIKTLADKCTWGNFYKNIAYCGVPMQPVSAVYPDDWYKGTISTTDKIWQVNADTGEIHQIAAIIDQADRLINTFNLSTDSKDNYLFFMNKNDLSLWSLDLVRSK